MDIWKKRAVIDGEEYVVLNTIFATRVHPTLEGDDIAKKTDDDCFETLSKAVHTATMAYSHTDVSVVHYSRYESEDMGITRIKYEAIIMIPFEEFEMKERLL